VGVCVKFGGDKRKLDWKQEAEMRKAKRKGVDRRNSRSNRHTDWEEQE